MKLATIPQLYRNLNRSIEVVSVLSKYGLADWLSRSELRFAKEFFKDRDGEALSRQTRETRVRLALSELGPTFIKLGQVLSTRADMVGVDLANELRQLQDAAPADPPAAVRALIEAELGRPVDELFAWFDDMPLASASIGQVHRARLLDGRDVVVKVRHPGIQGKIRVDLDILAGLAQLAEKLPEFQNYRPTATLTEFRRTLLRELDFGRELRNMQQFAEDFSDNPHVRVPRPEPQYSTSQVLTMEYLDGTRLCETGRLAEMDVALEEIARRGAKLFLEMIFIHGFYHADPHPGNIVVQPGGVIGLLDFGMVGRIDERLHEDLGEMLLAVGSRDAMQLTAIITRIGATPPDLDTAALSLDISDFVSHYSTQKLDEFDVTGALNELIEIIRRYQIMLPARVALLLKVLVMLEGTARLVNPRFSLAEVWEPYQSRLMLRRLSPGRQLRKMRRLYSELEHLAEVLPRGIVDILEQVQGGRFDIHLDHRGLEPSVNRLVLGLLASALFLGSSFLLSYKVPPLISLPFGLANELSLLGAAGCSVALALGLRLLRAINKSGHLDRRG